ncbi:alpha-L-rhamnosidase [Parabacteroides sp. PF5-5]|uniref:family 78 glycoside hydrolase catalytic domain n=1 Tax=unclassified Parabacteroides TaxID=2649774 RepID=UPI002473746A|nr:MULTISPECIES: family 78 glycoside hydrolase catalytic domain [unclassified Parabacteroides]MDH6303785.1 alpha-L-rhamnosidase [Parabacteroides sp. PH5-39]MDH6314402.1 alpha-L-rhamnosidase [Parabacteroides sp. PF5-13]MDH6318533.1 alpha-L-rhamnosidase [Parabacteroides sp. PH5-13]MDH6322174.1 alpha-L-rhamnosidase [Parabacteroides sp. PH5-8]MDH6325746.1 alpha-L-rhamnosidase [Parabacteroides sp. PH5-41]
MKTKVFIVVCTVALFFLYMCKSENKDIKPVDLRTEYLVDPIGIGTSAPRFTWIYDDINESQTTISRHQINIGTDPKNLQPYQEDMQFEPHTRYYWSVTVWDDKDRKCRPSEIASFETAKLESSDWSAQWITDQYDKEHEPSPLFRKKISLEKKVKEARIYIASAGYYELFINEERVGDNYLDPGYTHFDKRILYVTHDVSSHLKEGDNILASVLGNGWYNEQSVAVWNFHEARWRDRPRLLCELRVTYEDDSVDTFGTDESWKSSTGPYLYNNLYSSDIYDARLEKGWKTLAYDDSHWQMAQKTSAPAPLVVAQHVPGITITDAFMADSVRKFSDRLYVFSFPKNIAGLCQLYVKGPAGTKITLKYGELLKADGRLEQGNIDVYYHPVKPYEIFQTDVYYLAGEDEDEVFMPSFSYHGFQHVEVEASAPIELSSESLLAYVLRTGIDPVGRFSSSNDLLNKIWGATMSAYESNIHSIPTDCPQREKNGWTADAHVAIDLALLGYDGITFYEKWMDDFIDNQRPQGDISGIIPSSGWGYGEWPGPVWDAAMFIIPDALYNYYGDTRCIENLYPSMQRYLDYLQTKEIDGYLTYGLGDWVYWKATTNNEFTSTAYYYLDNKLMARFAKLLGKESRPYEEKAARLKELINRKFFDAASATYAEGTQTAQALPLYLGLVPEGMEQTVADKLRDVVAANKHFLDFGLIGSKTVPAMLTKYGFVDDAMKMLFQTEAPSWGYWVETLGYTTLPETWTLSPKFNDASLNHVFLGDVSAWMMNHLAGINYDTEKPGFRNIRFTPQFVKELDWAEGEYNSVSGLIYSYWRREGDNIVYNIYVPLNCTADIIVGGTTQSVGSGAHTFTYPNDL